MKKWLSLFLAVVMCLSFAACNSNTGTVNNDNSINSSDDKENEKFAVEENDKDDVLTVNLGDSITTDFMEMTVEDFQITKRLLSRVNSRGDNIILGEVAEGKKIAYLSGKIKNIHTDTIGNTYNTNDCIWGNICFDGKYNYDFKMYIENGENMEGDISPFGTGTYYLYAHIPNELLESYKSCIVNFGFCENLQAYDSSFGTGFSYDKCEYKYSVSLTK